MASSWLGKKRRNRAVRPRHVASLASAMGRGQFALTHAPIALAPDGAPFDGQHRLEAVVAHGASVWMYVARYATEEAVDATLRALDRGSRRGIGDTAIISGVVKDNGNKRAAAAMASILVTESMSYSDDQVIDKMSADIVDFDAIAGILGLQTHGTVLSAFVWMRPIDPVGVDRVAGVVATGVGATSTEAALAVACNERVGAGGNGMWRVSYFAKLCRGIELALTGKKMVRLVELRDPRATIERIAARRAQVMLA